MKNRSCLASALLIYAASILLATSVYGDDKEHAAVREAASAFYSALNAMFAGDLDPMVNVWSHDEDVTYMGPAGGFRHGWDEVLADWQEQASLNLGGQVEPRDINITVGRDLAVVSNYEIGVNTAQDGSPAPVAIRATNIFRKENGQWKMIGHHTDTLPFLEQETD